MLHSLDFNVKFDSSGLHYQFRESFSKGLIAITGPNESGKSLVLEMIRYCVFGTEALRAPLKEYAALRASLVFEVKGRTYKVARNKKNATLVTMAAMQEEETVLATGTSPVNTAIIGLLGFALTVFDTVLASLQDEAQKLTEMSPSARKQMVDSLTGLVGIQDVASECRSKSLVSKNMVAGLKEAYVIPLEPYEPLGYYPAHQVRINLVKVRELEVKLASAHRIINGAPSVPGDDPGVGMPSKVMERLVKANDVIKEKISGYKQELAANPMPSYTIAELGEQHERIAWADLNTRYPAPPLTQDQIDDMRVQWGRYKQVKRWHILSKELTRLRTSLIDCPACNHKFFVKWDQVNMYEQELGELSHLDLNENFSNLKEKALLDQWEIEWVARKQQPELDTPMEKPTLAVWEMKKQVQLHGFDREYVEKQIVRLERAVDPLVRDKFIKAVAQERDHALWKATKEAYYEWDIQAKQAQIDAQLIEKDLLQYRDIAELEQVLGEAIEYETLR